MYVWNAICSHHGWAVSLYHKTLYDVDFLRTRSGKSAVAHDETRSAMKHSYGHPSTTPVLSYVRRSHQNSGALLGAGTVQVWGRRSGEVMSMWIPDQATLGTKLRINVRT